MSDEAPREGLPTNVLREGDKLSVPTLGSRMLGLMREMT